LKFAAGDAAATSPQVSPIAADRQRFAMALCTLPLLEALHGDQGRIMSSAGTPPPAAARALLARGLSAQGIQAPVEVRRHPSARRMTLRISRARRAVIVTLPMQCDLDEAGIFLERHIEWVRERLVSLPAPVPFADGVVIPVRGAPHVIRHSGRSDPGPLVAVERDPAGMPRLLVAGCPDRAPRCLHSWLVAEARRDFDERVQWHAARLGLRPRRIAVRDQSSRWGSCSTTGVLSFSWRLVLAPPLILDYVAAHEVAHLAEMNHGPRFWALVRQTMPQTSEARRWLQVYGMDLHCYGSST
jgi:predicted metal-dependent hydrolase